MYIGENRGDRGRKKGLQRAKERGQRVSHPRVSTLVGGAVKNKFANSASRERPR